jgi:transposase-like protein
MAGSKAPHSSHKKSQFWLELVQAQATSGLGIADFCKQQNVSDSAFYKWRAKLAQEQVKSNLDKTPTQQNQRFTELVIRDSPQTITSSTPVPAPAPRPEACSWDESSLISQCVRQKAFSVGYVFYGKRAVWSRPNSGLLVFRIFETTEMTD